MSGRGENCFTTFITEILDNIWLSPKACKGNGSTLTRSEGINYSIKLTEKVKSKKVT